MHFTKKMIHPSGHIVDLGATSKENLVDLLARKVDAGFRPTDESIVDHAAKEEAERQAKKVSQTEVFPPPKVPDSASTSQPVDPVEDLPDPTPPAKVRKQKKSRR